MRLSKCNRCGAQAELIYSGPSNPAPEPSNWARLSVLPPFSGKTNWVDLCADCYEALEEKFLAGDKVNPLTRDNSAESDVSILTHEPTIDCQWLINPGTGQMICKHDDPDLFAALSIDQFNRKAKAEDDVVFSMKSGPMSRETCTVCGVEMPRYLVVLHMREEHPAAKVLQAVEEPEPTTPPWEEPLQINTDSGPLTQVSSDLKPASDEALAVLRAMNQRNDEAAAKHLKSLGRECSTVCSEGHTYKDQCALRPASVPSQRTNNGEKGQG